MSKRKASNIEELDKFVGDLLEEALLNSTVSRTRTNISQAYQKSIEQIVYNSYTPNKYERRGSDGGLLSLEYFESNGKRKNNKIDIMFKGSTPSNPNVDYTAGVEPPNYLEGIIEYGRDRGLYSKNKDNTQDKYMKPRPFTREAYQSIEGNWSHVYGLQDDLKKFGIKSDPKI